MKRYGNLYDRVTGFENMYEAYLDARRGKRKSHACFEFETNLSANLDALCAALADRSYCVTPYVKFWIQEPKPRLIYAPSFRDVVVQHAIYRLIYPLFDARFVDTTYACRIGGGTHKASDYMQHALRQYPGDLYLLQLDIKRYFYNIDRDILRVTLARTIKDGALLDLMMMFADLPDEPVGIPIGNLLSQLYAGIYLSGMDHFIKREMKIRHYVRYVDDFVLVGLTRERAEACLSAIKYYIWSRLNLELSKWRIAKISQGINFVGYRTWRSRRFIRKHSLYKFSRAVRACDSVVVNSLLGHAKDTNSLPDMVRGAVDSGLAVPVGFLKCGKKDNKS